MEMTKDRHPVKINNALWIACRTKAGRITGYLEVFAGRDGRYFSVPGVSRWMDA
jgi:hypothetical protein